jgi:hypothetical protein
MRRTTRLHLIGALTVLGALLAGSAAQAVPAPAPRLRIGVAHTQQSLDPWNKPDAVAAGRNLLASTPGMIQNQHLMGWGTTSPQPSPGVYDWRSLDRRMALIRQTHGTPVITLCCSPDWMKGGASGRTDWSRLAVAPTPDHYDDFAAMAAAVARRYPDVRTFLVWNEMKGFWDARANGWNAAAYTDLYNQVYRALKAVDPKLQVGGPYVSMGSWPQGVGGGRNSAVAGPWGMVDQRALDAVSYWLRHAVGADFVAVDGAASVHGGTFLVPPTQSVEKFAAVDRWLRSKTNLPIWWAEAYPVPFGSSARYSAADEAAAWVAAARALDSSGADVALLWQPESSSSHRGLWTSTASSSGGRATAIDGALRPWLH